MFCLVSEEGLVSLDVTEENTILDGITDFASIITLGASNLARTALLKSYKKNKLILQLQERIEYNSLVSNCVPPLIEKSYLREIVRLRG